MNPVCLRRPLKMVGLMTLFAILFIAAPASAQQCSASASANAGDEVTVLAILHTTDPNENGEGEPLTVSITNGGTGGTFPDYEVTHTFIFKAASTAPVTAVGTISGFDGDETCEVSVSINAKHRFTQTEKNVLVTVTGGFGAASGLSWVVAEACTAGIITAPICSLPAGLTAAVSATIAALAGTLLLIDPIDLNYTVIPVPEPAPIPLVTAGNGLTQADADAVNALLNNEAAIIGVLRAAMTSVNRASGAVSVGDTFWEQKQTDAISSFMRQLGSLLTRDANLREALVALLVSENFPSATVTPQQVLAFESQLAFLGWTPDQLALLRQLGNDDQIIETARRIVFTQDINTVAGNFPAAFANPAFIAALRQAGQDLTPYAGLPGTASCRGASVSALAIQFGGMSNASAALGFASVSDLQEDIRRFCGNQ
jgi:hypothetical protein